MKNYEWTHNGSGAPDPTPVSSLSADDKAAYSKQLKYKRICIDIANLMGIQVLNGIDTMDRATGVECRFNRTSGRYQ